MNGRYVIGAPLAALCNARWSVGISAAAFKAQAVLGAIRGGYINVLVADQDLARALLRLDSPELQRRAAQHIIRSGLNVAQTEQYVDRLCRKPLRRAKPIYRTRDVRLFLNTVQRGLAVMQSAGVQAQCGREETDREITLTIHIQKQTSPPSF